MKSVFISKCLSSWLLAWPLLAQQVVTRSPIKSSHVTRSSNTVVWPHQRPADALAAPTSSLCRARARLLPPARCPARRPARLTRRRPCAGVRCKHSGDEGSAAHEGTASQRICRASHARLPVDRSQPHKEASPPLSSAAAAPPHSARPPAPAPPARLGAAARGLLGAVLEREGHPLRLELHGLCEGGQQRRGTRQGSGTEIELPSRGRLPVEASGPLVQDSCERERQPAPTPSPE